MKIEIGRREREAQMREECSFIPSYSNISSNPQDILDQMDKSLMTSSASSSSSGGVKQNNTHDTNQDSSDDEDLSPHTTIPAIGTRSRPPTARQQNHHHHPREPARPPSTVAPPQSVDIPPSRSNYLYSDEQQQTQTHTHTQKQRNEYFDDEYEHGNEDENDPAYIPGFNSHYTIAESTAQHRYPPPPDDDEAYHNNGQEDYEYEDDEEAEGEEYDHGYDYGHDSRRSHTSLQHPAVYMQSSEDQQWPDGEGETDMFPPPLPPPAPSPSSWATTITHSPRRTQDTGSTYHYSNKERGVSMSSDLDEVDSMSLLEQLASTDFVDNRAT